MKSRVLGSVVVASALVAGLAGCNLVAPQATQKLYDAGDGVSADLGSVQLRNVLMVSDGEDGAALAMTAVNNGEATELQLDVDGEVVTVEVPGNTMTSFGTPGEDPIEIPMVDAVPGATVPVYAQHGAEPGEEMQVYLLTGALDEYGDLGPAPEPTIVEPKETGH